MSRWSIAFISGLIMLLWLSAALPAAAASAYYGKVTFNGQPLPGATIIATQGAKKFTTTSDAGGAYHFDNLPDGVWEIEVEMQLFAPIHAEVTVGPKTPVSDFALTPLSMSELESNAEPAKNASETSSVAVVKKPENKQAAEGNPAAPAPPPGANELSADGIVVNGSVNNAATSIYSTNPAFGNAHPGGRALYNGGFATFLDNSATDARPYNVSGVQAAKSTYTHMTDVVTLGGPLRIPHFLPGGPVFFLAYIWTRDNTAAIETGLAPTIAERTGNLAGLENAQGQPITVFNPATGQPYSSNMVPVSQQATSLLNLYPQPNIAGGTTYNYEAPVLNDTHQDSLQSHFTKTIARKDSFDGQFSFQSTRASTVNLFGFVDKTDTLYALAGDSGGKAFFDNNDLTLGIIHAQQAVSDYYILGYYTSNTAKNGHFRRVKVSLTNVTEANLSYREGYYAEKEFAKFNQEDKERQLEDALMLDDPITDLTVAMEIDYFQLDRAEYFVPIVVKIPGRELALAKRSGAQETSIDFVGEIKDVTGGFTVQNIRDHVSKKLSDATAKELATVPIEYNTGYTLLPGSYTIKFLARDDETGRMGTFETTFTIPNLNKVQDRVAMSSVVLSSQREASNAAVYDTEKAKERRKDEAVNPLVENGARLIPSVTRVFSKGRAIYVYFQAYKQTPTPATQPLFAFVTLYQNGEEVYKTKPESIVPSAQSRLGTMPLNFNLGVSTLPPGKYDCQVTVLDPTAQKANFWRAPIELVP